MADELVAAKRRLVKATRALGQQIVASRDVPWDFRTAVVLDDSPLTIDFGDGTSIANVARLTHYEPIIGDVVLVLVRSPATTVIGTFALGAERGTYSGTTDVNNRLVVTHGLGYTPSEVFLQSTVPSGGANQGYPVVDGANPPTGTTFTIRYLNTGGSLASQPVAGYWRAFP